MKYLFISLLLPILPSLAYTQNYPPPACVDYEEGVLTVCPPDSVPVYSGGLLGYNIYVNDVYTDFVAVADPTDTLEYVFDPLPDPGNDAFCAKVVYLNWISDASCDTALVRYGYDLPFFEDWESASFDTKQWTPDGNYWTIDLDEGNPSPCAAFHGQSGLSDYEISLESYPLLADTIHHGDIYLEFDLKLDCYNATGEDTLLIQVWNWTQRIWQDAVYPYTSENGSFNWTHKKINMNYLAREKVFRIRFVAEGLNAGNIEGWYIDNVNVYRFCSPPSDLEAVLTMNGQVDLQWISTGCGYWFPFPLTWSDEQNYDAIGTGGAVEFDVAARWTPAQLANYENQTIRAVKFFPNEASCTYTIRIWETDTADLVYEQSVANPVIGEWNEIELDSLFSIDISKMLWIGYHVNTTTGYPAGVDDGPAIDGSGNMMYWEDQWSTLLEINPELDYNWCITAYTGTPNPWYCANRIYRSVNEGEYQLIAEIPMYYLFTDENIDPGNSYCYLVTDYEAKYGDTCESAYSNEACIINVGMEENQSGSGILVYPNPATDRVTVETSTRIDRIDVMDLTGRIILTREARAKTIHLETGSLSEGIYLLKINTEDDRITRKVIIRRD